MPAPMPAPIPAPTPTPTPTRARVRLHRQGWTAAGIGGLVVVMFFLLLQRGIGGSHLSLARAAQWALLATLLIGIELIVLRRNLHKNRPTLGSPLYPSLGWGNGVTLFRGLAYALMAGFLFAPRPDGLLGWVPAILYITAITADYGDGYLARITHHTTLLGEILDIEFDGLGMLIAMALAVQFGQLPEAVLLLAASRPLFLWGMKVRERRGLLNHPMTPSDERRIAAGLLMGFMGIVLWPIFTPPATYIAGIIFGGAVAASFLRDWLVVIGWLVPASPGYIRWRARLKRFLFERLPLLLRLSSLPAAALLWSHISSAPGNWIGGMLFPIAPLLIGLGILAGIGALLGIITRLSALTMVCLACADLIIRGESPAVLALLAIALLLVLLGNGKPALWTPDEQLLRRRAGLASRTTKSSS